jgi:aspartyl-tRNA(Asn)/glutamyl-tRNA(Gln) amidotransferase subunit C
VSGLGREEVAHVAGLARLHLTDEELDLFTVQLASVLDHASDIESLDLSGVEPMSHPLEIRNVLRPDEPCPSLDRAAVLAAAPAVEENRFRVPRIASEPA